MIFLKYIGDHKKDTWLTRAGWDMIRFVQRNDEFKEITHSECVLAGINYKDCTIASSSARDGGVRIKEIKPENPSQKETGVRSRRPRSLLKTARSGSKITSANHIAC